MQIFQKPTICFVQKCYYFLNFCFIKHRCHILKNLNFLYVLTWILPSKYVLFACLWPRTYNTCNIMQEIIYTHILSSYFLFMIRLHSKKKKNNKMVSNRNSDQTIPTEHSQHDSFHFHSKCNVFVDFQCRYKCVCICFMKGSE